MSFEPLELVHHIVAEADYLMSESTSIDSSTFLADETRKRAFTRSLEIIGEAAKKLPAQFRDSHPETEWRLMAAMRDKLIHGYFGVDYELVWNVVTVNVPELRRQLVALLATARE